MQVYMQEHDCSWGTHVLLRSYNVDDDHALFLVGHSVIVLPTKPDPLWQKGDKVAGKTTR